MWWQWSEFANFQLDIVGFLALLGEGAVLANAQVSALSRLFLLPRLLPAPQALIRTTRPTALPCTTASVAGVHSGNVKNHVYHVANVLLGANSAMQPYTVRCVKLGIKKTAKATGPQTWVTLLGFAESLVLLAASITFGDGMSLLATIVLSLLSTVVGICNKWTLRLPKTASEYPPGDLVIRYPNGSFLVVKCKEVVARALYFAPEEIDYYIQNPLAYQMLSLLGTILLMLGIVFLANAKLQLQFGWAGAYVLINIAHWIAAARPEGSHWDLTCFEIEEQKVHHGQPLDNFTKALWEAIRITKSVQWVKAGGAAPQTPVWSEWLYRAEKKATDEDGPGNWDPKKEFDELIAVGGPASNGQAG
ncbi:hypothetical protein CERZMDRAFT_110414 [Cercospora zeae-maydis SCOH1-5]|uniref:Uncharacterized protein n=1 Tax=Cercospora zeae-maydis SCOH1-5 TaxID=717836 RepID=A0A6A6FMZ6_9PEZI|nr:hypothetical protein CERZMDRAFT_110414 [Cercospora zeae-maydis SCOH1-5]